MRYFQPDGFENDYNLTLQGEESKNLYSDPDCTTDVKKTDYYNLLTEFLNKREAEFKNAHNRYLFLPPKKSKATTKAEKKKHLDDYKIIVTKNDESLFRLTSDQFGFSAAERIYKNGKYPLSKILLLSKDNTVYDKEQIRNFIIKYVKNSRTLGGAFVWPLPKEGRRDCQYNKRRGNYSGRDKNLYQGYLEDRVDLTLLEVKHALDGDYDKDEHRSDILYDEYSKTDGIMKQWLKHFHSFDEYVEYFMLDSFVCEGMPIDIISGEKLDEINAASYKNRYKQNKTGQLQTLSLVELIVMLARLETMILERTRRMEEYIK